MQKEWFIQFQNGHKGPYDQDEIMQLWQCKKIHLGQMFWRKGMLHWQRFDHIEELQELFPPERLPGQQRKAVPPSPASPPLPAPGGGGGGKKFFFLVFLLLVLAGALELWRMNERVVRPVELAEREFQQLKEVLEVPIEQRVGFRFAFDPQVNRLWIASNLDHRAKLSVKLQALSGQVLSLGEIECRGKGKLQRHFANVDHFTFSKGSQLYPGLYKVYLSYGHLGQSFSDVIYLGPGNEQDFAQKLKVYKESVSKTFANYSSELVERYSTLSSLLNETEFLFKQRLGKISEGQEIVQFADDYASRIGPLLTEFTADNFSRPGNMPLDLSPMQRQFDILFDLSKSLANLSVEIVDTISSKGKIPDNYREKIQNFFLQKFETLKGNVQLHEKRIQSLEAFQ